MLKLVLRRSKVSNVSRLTRSLKCSKSGVPGSGVAMLNDAKFGLSLLASLDVSRMLSKVSPGLPNIKKSETRIPRFFVMVTAIFICSRVISFCIVACNGCVLSKFMLNDLE